jgi:hypothetical protein
VFEDLIRGIACLVDLPNENAATRCLAASLHASGIRRFWTAKSVWDALPGSVLDTSWAGYKAYDLSWASDPALPDPDNIAQVKIGTKDQEDQEVLLFLGDVAFAALDHAADERTAYCMAVIPSDRQTRYWSRLQPAGYRMKLILSPSTASDASCRQAPQAGLARTRSLSGYSAGLERSPSSRRSPTKTAGGTSYSSTVCWRSGFSEEGNCTAGGRDTSTQPQLQTGTALRFLVR